MLSEYANLFIAYLDLWCDVLTWVRRESSDGTCSWLVVVSLQTIRKSSQNIINAFRNNQNMNWKKTSVAVVRLLFPGGPYQDLCIC